MVHNVHRIRNYAANFQAPGWDFRPSITRCSSVRLTPRGWADGHPEGVVRLEIRHPSRRHACKERGGRVRFRDRKEGRENLHRPEHAFLVAQLDPINQAEPFFR